MPDYYNNIKKSGLTIFDDIKKADPLLYIPTEHLKEMLTKHLIGLSIQGLANRTKSKFVKGKICEALGYPVPSSFKRVRPRFWGQNFDVYVQQRQNIQIWNEPVDYNRRYVFLKVDSNFKISAIKVLSGSEFASFLKTKTLTCKYQATMKEYKESFCSEEDTLTVSKWVGCTELDLQDFDPRNRPEKKELLSVKDVFYRLLPMVGKAIPYCGVVRERNRGMLLQEYVCQNLGYLRSFSTDDGQFPDLKHQMLEIKLQTSPTIDLGMHSPDDAKTIFEINGTSFSCKDVRYVLFDGDVCGNNVVLKKLYVVTGADFTKFFKLFNGKRVNKKIQIPIPSGFFD